MEKWSKEKAWQWYNDLPWIRGFNGYPSNCVNRVAMWQSYKHDEVIEQIKYEFNLARETGFNAVRTLIHFEVWLYEHDSFMANLEQYLTLADEYGLKVMLTIGNDCNVPEDWYVFKLGEQPIDWGYHSGVKRGQHSGAYSNVGFQLNDKPEYTEKYYEMVDELAAKYAHDPRIQIWDVWNEIGNSHRNTKSVEYMIKCFEIIRSHDPIQPLTADVWRFDDNQLPYTEEEKMALELSDVITFHYYGSYQNMVKIIENLRELYDRPLINNEWLNRIQNNNVEEIFPLFYLEKVGSYHWGLIQGFSQTYEPWGSHNKMIADPNYKGDWDFTKYMHDLYRFNGLPYIAKEIEIIKDFSARADRKFKK